MLRLLFESALRSLILGGAVWIALKALRVRNPRTQSAAWAAVLTIAVLMPWLMRWSAISVPVDIPAVRASQFTPVVRIITLNASQSSPAPFDWGSKLPYVYVTIAALLSLRMAAGFVLTGLLWRRATPLVELWTAGNKVRTSADITVPVTFGSTILVPQEWSGWTVEKRTAVLLHEKSHVDRRDFYLQALAGLHRAIFWFSPLSWWIARRIAVLSEAASDDAVIAQIADRPTYAEILLDFARKRQPAAGVAMARPASVSQRVERILSETTLAAKTGLAKRLVLFATIAPIIALVAGFSMRAQNPAPPHPSSAPPQAGNPAPPQEKNTRHASTSQIFDSDASKTEPFAIVTGDSMTMNGPMSMIGRAQKLRGTIHGKYIWFERNGKAYFITDSATIDRAEEFFAAQQELGRRQGELGELQGRLGEQQAELGEQQRNVSVPMPDYSREMEKLKEAIVNLQKEFKDSAGRDAHQSDLSDLQARLAEVQAKLANIQSQGGERQAQLGALQAQLGQRQSKLGEEQAKLGEEQGRLAREASVKMRKLLEEALQSGIAKPVE